MPADLVRLRDEWDRLLRPFRPAPEAGERAFAELTAYYSSPDRFYHTLEHVGPVLETAADLAGPRDNLTEIRLAAWFHDAIYDSKAGDNEERSAAYAGAVLPTLGVPSALCGRVQELILRTKTHQAPAGDREGQVLLDADLAILGAPAEEYRRYARAIRQEYAWVPDDQFRSGRRKVLLAFLARLRIFSTEKAFQALEAPARGNMAAEVASLEGKRADGDVRG